MKERPILFSAPMVRAILDGRKTQTRRIVKPPPHADIHAFLPFEGFWKPAWGESALSIEEITERNQVLRCRYGAPGDRLWVREAWFNNLPEEQDRAHVYYRADPDEPDFDGETIERDGGGWRPSIHMPRWASRLTLEVTGVRVERLHEITEDGARLEGASPCWLDTNGEDVNWGAKPRYRQGFAMLWKQINGPDSWAANPWVWVLDFRKAEG